MPSATATSRPDKSACAASSWAVPVATLFPTPAAQRVQFGEPSLVAGAPGGHAITQPVLFHRDLAAELVLLAFFLLQDCIAPRLECRETLVQHSRNSAVEPYGAAREPFEQPSVMADQHHARAH